MKRILPVLVVCLSLVACGGGGAGAGGSPESEGPEGPAGQTPNVGAGRTAIVLGANDLGMHCIDREFSVYSILPPFNVIQAQVVRRGTTGAPRVLVSSEVVLTYESVADASGSVNSTSLGGKTDFWTYVAALYGGTGAAGQGLTGLSMPADAPAPGPQPMDVDAGTGWFHAFGIPLTPVDDAGRTNPYPILRLAARDRSTGELLGTADIAAPVSSETDCSGCHQTGGVAASAGGITWSSDTDVEKQTKENVLRLHDAKQGTSLSSSKPVLCASCHYSAALDLTGTGPSGAQVGKPTFSRAMHGYHASRTDGSGAPVFPPDGTTLQTCYQCHPGRVTECHRGAMKTGGMTCRDCHGTMAAVGAAGRAAWVDLPGCGSCHTGDANSHVSAAGAVAAADGIRLRQAYLTGDGAATPITPVSSRFAEESGKLFRRSSGHGGLACTACHGSPHAIWPVADPASNDNVLAVSLQGYAGTLLECSICHGPGTLGTTLSGPHGMHPVGDPAFVDESHGHLYERNPASCTACHGTDLRGTVLSRAGKTRTLRVEDAGTVTLPAGQPVGCTHCHEDPADGGVDDD